MAASHAQQLGEVLPLWSVLPFAGMLLSIALFPLFAPKFWHDHFGKVSVFWGVAVSVPFLIFFRGPALHELLHTILADYIPFVILLASLYAVSGGIFLRGSLTGTPLVNTAILAAGTVLASWMGTTGAAMLLIRPFLRANAWRRQKSFMVAFFIFLVANVGGVLTPLGDPPLFLGFLRGVPFFWTVKILPHMLLVALVLLAVYFVLDVHFYRKEGAARPDAGPGSGSKGLAVEGWHNLFLLLGIIGGVLLSGMARWGEVLVLGVHRGVQDLVRDAILVAIIALSMATTPRRIRDENEFTWFPLKEVAILFAAIFLTMVPCLKILQAGPKGAFAFATALLAEPAHYFWLTGVFSSFLDNAPTYLTFLNTAAGGFYPHLDTARAIKALLGEHPAFLEAVSAGAVFFGAFTYIGNAPNFMVRSIAEEYGTPMPGFFGFVIKYSLPFLLPVYVLVSVIFF